MEHLDRFRKKKKVMLKLENCNVGITCMWKKQCWNYLHVKKKKNVKSDITKEYLLLQIVLSWTHLLTGSSFYS